MAHSVLAARTAAAPLASAVTVYMHCSINIQVETGWYNARRRCRTLLSSFLPQTARWSFAWSIQSKDDEQDEQVHEYDPLKEQSYVSFRAIASVIQCLGCCTFRGGRKWMPGTIILFILLPGANSHGCCSSSNNQNSNINYYYYFCTTTATTTTTITTTDAKNKNNNR